LDSGLRTEELLPRPYFFTDSAITPSNSGGDQHIHIADELPLPPPVKNPTIRKSDRKNNDNGNDEDEKSEDQKKEWSDKSNKTKKVADVQKKHPKTYNIDMLVETEENKNGNKSISTMQPSNNLLREENIPKVKKKNRDRNNSLEETNTNSGGEWVEVQHSEDDTNIENDYLNESSVEKEFGMIDTLPTDQSHESDGILNRPMTKKRAQATRREKEKKIQDNTEPKSCAFFKRGAD